MVYVITGEDTVLSRKKLSELLEGSQDITRVDGEKELLSNILTTLESNSLFSKKRAVVIENFLKVRPLESFLEQTLKFVKDQDTDVFLWDEGEVDLKSKTMLKNVKTFSFSFPKYYYQFLDSFSPSSNDSASLFRDVLKTLSPEQVLYGLIKRVKQLLVIKSGGWQDFSDFRRMQSWQISKLTKQADRWTLLELKSTFVKLAELDEKIKTGGLALDLPSHLDILLLSDLN